MPMIKPAIGVLVAYILNYIEPKPATSTLTLTSCLPRLMFSKTYFAALVYVMFGYRPLSGWTPAVEIMQVKYSEHLMMKSFEGSDVHSMLPN